MCVCVCERGDKVGRKKIKFQNKNSRHFKLNYKIIRTSVFDDDNDDNDDDDDIVKS